MARKRGDNYKLTEETIQKLEEAFRSGASITMACFAAHISRTTFHRWVSKNPRLAKRLAEAQAQLILRSLKTMADNAHNPRWAAWLLAHKLPEEFGKNSMAGHETYVNIVEEQEKELEIKNNKSRELFMDSEGNLDMSSKTAEFILEETRLAVVVWTREVERLQAKENAAKEVAKKPPQPKSLSPDEFVRKVISEENRAELLEEYRLISNPVLRICVGEIITVKDNQCLWLPDPIIVAYLSPNNWDYKFSTILSSIGFMVSFPRNMRRRIFLGTKSSPMVINVAKTTSSTPSTQDQRCYSRQKYTHRCVRDLYQKPSQLLKN